MICQKCGASTLRREERRGFFQLKVFPLFGLYPWECTICREVGMYRRQFAEKRTRLPLQGDERQGSPDSAPEVPFASQFDRKPTR